MLNRIVLIGRLVRDPELRYTPTNNTPVCTFSLQLTGIGKMHKEKEKQTLSILLFGVK